jgi:hypothetical protein
LLPEQAAKEIETMSERVLNPNRALLRGLVIGAFAVTVAGISAVAQPGDGPGGGL